MLKFLLVIKMIIENIKQEVIDLSKKAEIDLKEIFAEIDDVCFYNSNRILSAFIENRIEEKEQMEKDFDVRFFKR